MTFKQLYEEVVARGFENVAGDTGGEARIKRWINQAYRDVAGYRPWHFLQASKEGSAPLEIADLGHVLSIVNLTNDSPLSFVEQAALRKFDPSLEATGIANLWFLDGADTIRVHPADTNSTLLVNYLKVPARLTEDGDEPIVPEDHQETIIDGAAMRAYKMTDNYEARREARIAYRDGLASMVRELRVNYDSSRMIVRTGTVNDYL